jgi:hypothetical protein
MPSSAPAKSSPVSDDSQPSRLSSSATRMTSLRGSGKKIPLVVVLVLAFVVPILLGVMGVVGLWE